MPHTDHTHHTHTSHHITITPTHTDIPHIHLTPHTGPTLHTTHERKEGKGVKERRKERADFQLHREEKREPGEDVGRGSEMQWDFHGHQGFRATKAEGKVAS